MNRPRIARQWVKPEILALKAYHVADAEGLVKLDPMENPYTWPEPLLEAWLHRLRSAAVNRYPDGDARQLKARLREYMDLPAEVDLLLGNGSDELIQVIGLALAGPDRVMLAPEPTFVMYRVVAEVLGFRYVGVPLRAPDFGLDVDAMLAAIKTHSPAVVFIARPNNPTGNLFAREELEAVIGAAPGLVVIDEAYAAFAGESWLPDLGGHPKLVVLQTLSKAGLAGLRIGMLAGDADWLSEFNKVRLPYNINVLSQLSAAFILEHADFMREQAAQICRDRTWLFDRLEGTDGVEVWPSAANFLLLRVASARAVFEAMKRRGVLVKCLDGAHPLLRDCLRVTVGTPGENQAFLDALAASL
jgi:histidinol-phosphate aminotransferase